MLNKPVSSNDQIEHYIVRLGKWLSMHPSQILNIYHKRGSISKGKLADLIVWELEKLNLKPFRVFRKSVNFNEAAIHLKHS